MRNRKLLRRHVPTTGQPHLGAPLPAVQQGPNVNMSEGQPSSEHQHGSVYNTSHVDLGSSENQQRDL